MTHDEALQKVVKFLKLSKSDNPHEAAAALARAQDIMDRFKLQVSLDTVDSLNTPAMPEEPIKHFDAMLNEEDKNDSKLSRWKSWLAVVIAEANHCKVVLYGAAVQLVGRASDAETVRYLYAVLVREVDRLAERDARGNGRTWANNYRLGVVETLGKRLKESQAQTQQDVRAEAFAKGGEGAIVLVNQSIEKFKARGSAVEKWMKDNLKLRKGTTSRTRYDSNAREAGRKAGNEVKLGGAKGGLNAGHKELGA